MDNDKDKEIRKLQALLDSEKRLSQAWEESAKEIVDQREYWKKAYQNWMEVAEEARKEVRNLKKSIAWVEYDALEEGFEIAEAFACVDSNPNWFGAGSRIDMSNSRYQLKKRLNEIKITQK